MLTRVFNNQSGNGDSAIVQLNGGEVEIIVDGNFGASGTVTAKARYRGMTDFVPLDNGEWTGPMIKVLRVPRPCELRLSAVGTTTINAWV
jgi:hypothetical protein